MEPRSAHRKLGEILTGAGSISEDQLRDGLGEQSRSGERLGSCLRRLGHLSEEALLDGLAEQLRLPRRDLARLRIPAEAVRALPQEFVRRHRVIPIEISGGALRVAASDPLDPRLAEDIRLLTGLEVEEALAPAEQIAEKISECYALTVERLIEDLHDSSGEDLNGRENLHEIEVMANEPTVINLVNLIISTAIRERASDIHLVPFEKALELRYRVDGLLQIRPPPPRALHAALVSRIKIMADLNIAERFVPQDGHFQIHHRGAQVDVRVGTMPTIHGESAVLRLLEKTARVLSPEELGLDAERSRVLQALARKPHGLLLATGPTGCGKTTTLYSVIRSIYTPELKILTIEDPVEYELPGVAQIPVRPARGFTFATGLRALLRQDPDVIMVGEIRDTDTAEIAIRAALTGHLVFSTLHTNDASGAVTRLIDMGVEPFLIASSLEGVLAQRLARTICAACRHEAPPLPGARLRLEALGIDPSGAPHFRGAGCEECRGTGYRGRTGLFELLVLSPPLRELISHRRSSGEIQSAASRDMLTIKGDGLRKAAQGITTLDELVRVALSEAS